MKRKSLLAALLTVSVLATAGCSLGKDTPSETTVTPTAVYDVEAADYQQTGNGLNASSAATVALAKEEGLFTTENKDGDFSSDAYTKHAPLVFTNNAGGYDLTVPADFAVVDMGDATYRSTLASDTMRLEIFTQTLTDDVSADTYLNYSNKFLENTQDFTNIVGPYDTTDGPTTRTYTWERRKLSRVDGDRNYYANIDIIDDKKVYTLLLSSENPIDENFVSDLRHSFHIFEPTVTAKEYPRFVSGRTNLNEETQAFYDTVFAHEDSFTWGIFEPTVGPDGVGELPALQETVDHKFDILLYYANMTSTSYEPNRIYKVLENAWSNDSVVELTLQTTRYDPTTQANDVYAILDGEYDDYLHGFAADVARFGHPVLFRPFNEMNGDWCNYSAYWSARDADTYIELYRYVYSIFEEEGANANTLWIWNPNERSFPNFCWNDTDNYYPGDEYVDLVGLTGYNTGDYYDGEVWRSFTEIYDPIYADLAPQYNQPLLITEFSCSNFGGDKAAWVEDMFKQLENYPRIRAAVWWNGADYTEDKEIARSYFIDDNTDALALFTEHLDDREPTESH